MELWGAGVHGLTSFTPRLIRQKAKNHREIRKCSPNPAEMTGDSCMARAVVLRYSSGRRPCRHRTHWAVRTPDFLVVFFIGIFCHFDCRSAANRKVLLHFSFSLEGKCHEVAKGCTRVIMILILHCCSTLGQLRLTWRLYAESPQSGEISSPQ